MINNFLIFPFFVLIFGFYINNNNCSHLIKTEFDFSKDTVIAKDSILKTTSIKSDSLNIGVQKKDTLKNTNLQVSDTVKKADTTVTVSEKKVVSSKKDTSGFVEDEIEKLKKSLTDGWELSVFNSYFELNSSLYFANVFLTNKKIACTFPVIEKKKKTTTTQSPLIILHFFRLEDKPKIMEIEKKTITNPTYCPISMIFSQTKKYYVTLSPCHRNFNQDPKCQEKVREFENKVKDFLKNFR